MISAFVRRRSLGDDVRVGIRCTFLPRSSGPSRQLPASVKNRYGIRISIDRIERLTPHATINTSVMMDPIVNAVRRVPPTRRQADAKPPIARAEAGQPLLFAR